jgi:hypothetical protein
MYERDEYQISVVRRMSQPDAYDIWYLWAAKQRVWSLPLDRSGGIEFKVSKIAGAGPF